LTRRTTALAKDKDLALDPDPAPPHAWRMTKPGEHPEFFRFPAPPGRSRESTIVLDAAGAFTHDGERVVHPGLAQAMHTWIRRHPDDGRYILSNGYDWTYFTVLDAPFTVEAWSPADTRVGVDGALYAGVKRGAAGGPFEAKFTRHAQAALEPYLVEEAGRPALQVGATRTVIGPR
jgi:hypothetical protein